MKVFVSFTILYVVFICLLTFYLYVTRYILCVFMYEASELLATRVTITVGSKLYAVVIWNSGGIGLAHLV